MLATATLTMASNAADDAPCCWLCHEEGQSGKPLVRKCSCRGSTGFAHLSCIVDYAEYQGKKALLNDNLAESITKAFDICPNCGQEYQGLVEYELKKAAVDFAEKEFKDTSICVHAMKNRLVVLDAANEEDKQEGEELCTRIISVIEDMKQDDFALRRWHIKDGYVNMETGAYGAIGIFYMRIGTEVSLERAKTVLEKGRDLLRRMGDEMSVLVAEEAIKEVQAKINATNYDGPELDSARKYYEHCIQIQGESNLYTIAAGRKFAYSLFSTGCTIGAERLLHSLLETCRQTHGPDHDDTVATAACLRAVRSRKVILKCKDEVFKLLRCEDEGKTCVLRGPLTDPEKMDHEGQIITVASSDIALHYRLATPVVCHGLVNRAHLNGKIGDAREVDRDNRVCRVHFEEAGLEPAEIKYENLRILFELPP